MVATLRHEASQDIWVLTVLIYSDNNNKYNFNGSVKSITENRKTER